ncbi:MAG TPA: NAD(P)/FAD-dependent oxidoreductase [Candidatus Limnocylindrales bacterium]|nr:NAD(P)/FAD-dependent oxidoreductase [Candidatus Limnocylindrales bacterium]
MANAPRKLPNELTLDLGLDESQEPAELRRRVARQLQRPEDSLPELVVLKRSIDARRGRVRFHVVVGPAASLPENLGGAPLREVDSPERVAIIGDGPAGLFCAYELARHGIGATIYDRGKPVQPRRRDLRGLQQEGIVNPDSNYCFGEGGAGTYSDGKLYTRSHKRGDVRDVIELLAVHGAPEAILTDARPHIGSNKLPRVITALREHLEQVGTRFVFGARVIGLLRDAGGAAAGVRVADVDTGAASEHGCEAVVLATGHSARDVYTWLAEMGVAMEAKGFAAGVRIEHPQPLIDSIQYGASAGHPALPAAAYRLAHTEEGRGVFSFCMCPGGFIVPAATEPGEVVVNGMSLSRRDSPFANSGLVVAIEPEDLAAAGYNGALAGVKYQRRLERLAFEAGGGALKAPATRATDFLAGRSSTTASDTSYQPGVTASNVADVLDGAGIVLSQRLAHALAQFNKRMRGYVTAEALLVGVETRTSSPVRVPRHPETWQSPGLPGLYPCGEGAGYAGGIISAAMDGIGVARSLAASMRGTGR